MPMRYPNQLNTQPSVAARQQALQQFYAIRAQNQQRPQAQELAPPDTLDTMMAWHPSWMLDWVNNKIKQATNQ